MTCIIGLFVRAEGVNTDSYLTNTGYYPQTTKEKLSTQLDDTRQRWHLPCSLCAAMSANSLDHGKMLFLVENTKSIFVIWVDLESVLYFTVLLKCAHNFSSFSSQAFIQETMSKSSSQTAHSGHMKSLVSGGICVGWLGDGRISRMELQGVLATLFRSSWHI